jgi:hypothetical protein
MQFDWQLAVVILIVGWAIAYLAKRFLFTKKATGCGSNCGCHPSKEIKQ